MKAHQPWKESTNEKIYFMNMWHGNSSGGSWPAREDGKLVYFQFFAPEAKTVRLAGDFNQWDPILMRRRQNGWWSIQMPLLPGLHQYRFLVNTTPLVHSRPGSITNDEDEEPVSLIAVK